MKIDTIIQLLDRDIPMFPFYKFKMETWIILLF